MPAPIKRGFTVRGKRLKTIPSNTPEILDEVEKREEAQKTTTAQPPSSITTTNLDERRIIQKRLAELTQTRSSSVTALTLGPSSIQDRSTNLLKDTTKTIPGVTSPRLLQIINQEKQREDTAKEMFETNKKSLLTRTFGDIDEQAFNPYIIEDDDLAISPPSGFTELEPPGIDEITSLDAADFNFQPNILSLYDNPAYNFKFFVVNPKATHVTLAEETSVIIAETGSTGFNITDVVIHSGLAPSPVAHNAFLSKLKMTIIEPHGSSLFDRMRNAAVQLGAKNHMKVPYWLELSFKGYTPSTDESHVGGDPTAAGSIQNITDLNNEVRAWQVTIASAEAKITKGGTEYIFELTPTGEVGLRDTARRLEKNEHIDAADLGEFFDGLTKNLKQYKNYSIGDIVTFQGPNNLFNNIDRAGRLRTYEFTLPTDIPGTTGMKPMKEWQIRPPEDNRTDKKRSGSFVLDISNLDAQSGPRSSNRKFRISFGQGSTIEAVVQEIIGATVEGQALLLLGENKPTFDAGEETARDPTKPSIAFVVDPVVDIDSYNRLAKDFNININYHIRPFLSFYPIISRRHLNEARENPIKAKNRLFNFLKAANIQKRYDYIFTGLNTEILDFNLKINHAWFVPLPIFHGQNRGDVVTVGGKIERELIKRLKAVQKDLPITADEFAETAKKDLDELTERQKIIDAGILGAEAQFRDGPFLQRQEITAGIIQDARNTAAVEEAKIRQSTAAKMQSIVDAFARQPIGASPRIKVSDHGAGLLVVPNVNPNLVGNIDNNVTILSSVAARTVAQNASRGRLKVPITNDRITASDVGSIFAEDLSEISVGRNIEKEDLEDILIIPTEPEKASTPYMRNIEATASKGRSLFSAVLNQLYGVSDRLQTIDLEIRGDPYWLGDPDTRSRVLSSSAINRDLTSSNALFILTMGFPKRFNDGGLKDREFGHAGTGLAEIERAPNGFNGVYHVQEVVSTFSGGKFTQKLIAFIDILTKEEDVISLAINGIDS